MSRKNVPIKQYDAILGYPLRESVYSERKKQITKKLIHAEVECFCFEIAWIESMKNAIPESPTIAQSRTFNMNSLRASSSFAETGETICESIRLIIFILKSSTRKIPYISTRNFSWKLFSPRCTYFCQLCCESIDGLLIASAFVRKNFCDEFTHNFVFLFC